MKSPAIVTLSIIGVLFTGTAAIAVNSSAFVSVEQNRLGVQSALLTPSVAPTLAALVPEAGETAVPAPDGGAAPEPASEAPTARSTTGVKPGAAWAPVSGETQVPIPAAAAAPAPAPAVVVVPVPPAAVLVPAPSPIPTHRSDDNSNEHSGQKETEHDD
jgi:hypothetical protein